MGALVLCDKCPLLYFTRSSRNKYISVADLGFSPGGAPTPKVDVLTNFFGRKLHENERIWTPRGGRASLAPPLRSATAFHIIIVYYKLLFKIQYFTQNRDRGYKQYL